MNYLQERRLTKPKRGDKVKAVELPGRRVTMSRSFSARPFGSSKDHGFTLIELVITITVLTILTLGVVPLLKVSVKRQKEEQLRATLRQMRTAIDEFHRDTMGMPRAGLANLQQQQQQQQPPQQMYIDPRSKVVISDPTIFGVDNPDLYPPDLETLVSGVNVIPRGGNATGAGVAGVNATDVGNGQLATKKKVYLRAIPINPFTGGNKVGTDWELRSCYDAADRGSWGGENVFDVVFPRDKDQYFKPMKEDDKYSDW
ncbi:MAG: type II secretion system GspH family protein [Acidobacteriota bacterium]|nr:type II secretion system GspH family protein [Acidobacteriota bacterium]